MNNKIYMIGSMGSGKSSIGRLLAKKLHLPHYDLDKTIEHNEGMSVTDIFKKYNEEYFRDKESVTLERYSRFKEFVISTGGGAILSDTIYKKTSDIEVDVSFLSKEDVISSIIDKLKMN